MQYRRFALLLLEALIAVFFALQGVTKIAGSPTWIARFRDWGYPEHFYLFAGALELLGALMLVVPRTRVYGASTLAAVMVCATITHAVHRQPQFISTLVILALLAVVIVARTRGPRRASPEPA